ncbi:MAG: hypothetical protein NUV54_03675 [Candidatus Taylorbacteria bacterium]|nr:hypothetical protein [Candidatus Taylorbacteria bacterium]
MQKALLTGYHRCSNDGQTVYAKGGASLAPCSCGQGKWEYLASDNHRDPAPLLVGTGIIFLTEVAEVPERGTLLHMRGGGMPQAVYKVLAVKMLKWKGEEQFHIEVMRVGDADPKLPLYLLSRITV